MFTGEKTLAEEAEARPVHLVQVSLFTLLEVYVSSFFYFFPLKA